MLSLQPRTKNERSRGLRAVGRNDLRPFSPKIFLAIAARRLWTLSLPSLSHSAHFALSLAPLARSLREFVRSARVHNRRRSLRPTALSPLDLSFLVRGCRLNTLSISNQLPCRRSIVRRRPCYTRERPQQCCSFGAVRVILHLSCTYPAPILHLSCTYPAPILHLSCTCLLFTLVVVASSSRRGALLASPARGY